MSHKLKVSFTVQEPREIKATTIIELIDCDETFEEDVNDDLTFNSGDIRHTLPQKKRTRQDQADSWLRDQGNILQDVIDRNDLVYIIDWEIIEINGVDVRDQSIVAYEKMSELDKISLVLIEAEKEGVKFSKTFKEDFLHTYKIMEVVLQDIDLEKKIEIILTAMGVGIDKATRVLKDILDLYRDFETTKAIEKNNRRHKLKS